MAFNGAPQGAVNSDPIPTKTGTNTKPIFTATSTKVTQDTDGKVNGGTTTLYYSTTPGNYIPAATTTNGGKTWTYLKDSNGKEILDADAKRSLETGALKTNTQQQIISAATKASIPKEQQKIIAPSIQNTGSSNVGAASTPSIAPDQLKEENAKYRSNTRPDYFTSPPLKYPLNLSLTNQDCIKFSIIEYKPPGVKPNTSESGSRIVSLVNESRNKDGLKVPGLPKGQSRKILGTIILPIPGGISDRNTADWSGDKLDEFQRALSDMAFSGITGGGPEFVDATQRNINNSLAGGTGSLTSIIAAKGAEMAANANNLLERQYGSVFNPNLELLFTGPQLRSFQFTFRFTPREPDEAKAVKKIIRYFKQAMSVKRSANSLLLKAPHTFAISYMTSDKQHPYLNRFKECALTDCSVNYTPDGTYMTYREPDPNKKEDIQFRSMTAYELTLSFQELEPIFDDDYYEVDQNKDREIGF